MCKKILTKCLVFYHSTHFFNFARSFSPARSRRGGGGGGWGEDKIPGKIRRRLKSKLKERHAHENPRGTPGFSISSFFRGTAAPTKQMIDVQTRPSDSSSCRPLAPHLSALIAVTTARSAANLAPHSFTDSRILFFSPLAKTSRDCWLMPPPPPSPPRNSIDGV